MRYEISGADLSDFIAAADERDIPSVGENTSRIELAVPGGDIHYRAQVVRDHLSIIEGHYHMRKELTIAGKGDSALLEIQFNLSDRAIAYRDKSATERTTPAGSGNIAFLAAEENQARILFQKESSYHTFDIHIPLSLLDRYAGESKLLDTFLSNVHKGISTNLAPSHIHITPAIYNCIQDMKTCTFEGLTRKIYLESKTFEIVALLYENAGEHREISDLSPADREKIHEAASVIRKNLEQPLTIIELAQRVGINQTKLKTGFRALFGNTVFGYLQDTRMYQAKRYLLDTELSVQEIGMRLGYRNVSNFSSAFKNTHGYPPMKLREKPGTV